MRATAPSAGAASARAEPYLAAICASNSLQDGEHTGCDLPKSFLDLSIARGRCLPQRKQDIVAAPKEEVAAKGEPGALER